jgi:hypothetical protein
MKTLLLPVRVETVKQIVLIQFKSESDLTFFLLKFS